MGSTEKLFPTNISYGSRGGPGFSTAVIENAAGQEERTGRWNGARRRYNAVYGLKSPSDLSALLTFYIIVRGPELSFRYKDFSDYTTASDHYSAPDDEDHEIGVGDGSNVFFQLRKKYEDGTYTRIRNITKPVAGTVVVALDGVAQTEGVDFTVDDTTGIVTFTTAPGVGVSVTAGCEFHVPARFGIELDKQLPISIDGFEAHSIQDIPIVEVRDELPIDDERYLGGHVDFGDLSADIMLALGKGALQILKPTVGSLTAYLPIADDIPPGINILVLTNDGSNDIDIRTQDDTLVLALTTGSVAHFHLSINSSNAKTWIALAA